MATEGISHFENYVRVSLENKKNHFYSGDEENLGVTSADIKPIKTITTDEPVRRFDSN